MTWTLRLICLCLAVVVAVTSQQMAVARGAMQQSAGQVVLCTGQGERTVTLDRQGNPMDVVHICPDCALTLAVAPPADVPQIVPLVHIYTRPQWPVLIAFRSIEHSAQFARGPPVLI